MSEKGMHNGTGLPFVHREAQGGVAVLPFTENLKIMRTNKTTNRYS